MTPIQVLDQFRSEMSDESAPHLWSDDEALLYLIDAQDQLVTAMGGIADASTAAICQVAVVADEPMSAHSPYILRIRSARLASAARDVRIINEADLGRLTLDPDYGHRTYLTLDDEDTGAVTHGVLGIEKDKIRWVRVPSESDTAKLNVLRLPYPRITAWNDSTLEVDERYHLHLVTGMRALAYRKQDAEARDDAQADRFEKKFLAYCEEARRATERKKYKPRTVQYGGIG